MNRGTTLINLAATTLAMLVLASVPNVTADEYVITELGTFGGSNSWAGDVNESGQVVGTADLPGGHPQHPFLWENGVMTDLGTLGGCCSYGYDINNPGQITGLSYVIDGTYRAYLWENGVTNDLGTLPGFEYSTASGLNDAGQVIGYSNHVPGGGNQDYTPFLWESGVMIDLHDTLPPGSTWELRSANDINGAGQMVGHGLTPAGHYYAFRLQNGEATDLGTLSGYDSSSAHSSNDVGQIVGTATRHFIYSSINQAFLWENGVMVGLGRLPFHNHSGARDINDEGQVVGYSSLTSTRDRRAVLWQAGAVLDLNELLPPGSAWTLESASAINNAGQIVGYGMINNETRGFLMTPRTLGDLNGDGCVDLIDLGILLADFGCTPPATCAGDLDGDGDTDLADLGILLTNFGMGC